MDLRFLGFEYYFVETKLFEPNDKFGDLSNRVERHGSVFYLVTPVLCYVDVEGVSDSSAKIDIWISVSTSW